jgi:hypothetical protein
VSGLSFSNPNSGHFQFQIGRENQNLSRLWPELHISLEKHQQFILLGGKHLPALASDSHVNGRYQL